MNKEEIIVIEIIRAVKGKVDELKRVLEQIVLTTRKVKGCLQYDLLRPMADREEFLVLMRWEKLADLHRHETSDYIAEFVRKNDKYLYDDVSQTEWKKLL